MITSFTLAAQNNISTYLRGPARRGALGLAERTLDGLGASLGDDHPFTLSCEVIRANRLHDLGRFTERRASSGTPSSG